jgi:hypothetical protein
MKPRESCHQEPADEASQEAADEAQDKPEPLESEAVEEPEEKSDTEVVAAEALEEAPQEIRLYLLHQ